MPRLFVAAWPPAPVKVQLLSLPRPEQRGVRWVAPDNWHITLRFLGDAEIADVAARLDEATLPPASTVMGPVVRRLGRNMAVVPAAGLEELAAAVSAATADVGVTPDERRFRGHVTVARLKPGASCDAVGLPFEAEFPVVEVTLVDSVLSHRGAKYRVVRRWLTRS